MRGEILLHLITQRKNEIKMVFIRDRHTHPRG